MADPMPENTSDGAATAGGAATPDAAAASDSTVTSNAAETPKKSTITPMRIALWVLVGGAGLFMVLTGLVGVLVKAQ
ncbi:hypothetical protein [Salinibacterium sp. SWN1162]|uniref:hypothetical protein n=1 Tax=Salinibacterium sp. SWN1162 TaxID=2792053 RepID=UPI0018CEDA9F|nr:hypothetical protein [Salinibacterium sp. SWN1162]MBH0008334.1 hypothetical protein [Salinibacterium sp. SWN1162]